MPEIITHLFVLLTGFVISAFSIPSIIQVARKRTLFDLPDSRKQHSHPTPPLGGIAIFLGMLVAASIWIDFTGLTVIQYPFLALMVLFFMGLKDDLVEIKATTKLMIQLSVAAWVAFGGIRIESLNGFLGIEEIPVWTQYTLTILFITGFTNAYNLIDGIDGLAGGIALIATLTFGILFFLMGDLVFAMLCCGLAGSLLGFLKYNYSPAKIFMGDTGSLSVGLILAVFAIRFLQGSVAFSPLVSNGLAVVLIFAILIVPFIDITQVIFKRLLSGKSPFSPDRGHLHHMLLRTGKNHRQATSILYGITLSAIGLCTISLYLQVAYNILFVFILVLALTSVYQLYQNSTAKEDQLPLPESLVRFGRQMQRALIIIQNYLF